MGLKDQQKKLFSEFPPVTTDEWEEKIKADLKGADYQKKLIWRTDEGFDVKPYYRAEDLQGLEYLQSLPEEYCSSRGNKTIDNKWLIRQDIPIRNVEEANRIALDALNQGADALSFCAIGITKHKQMNRLLAGIDLSKTNISFMSSRSYPLTLELLIYEIIHRQSDFYKISGSLNFDPISYLLLHGDFYTTKENNFDEAEYLVNTIEKKQLNLRSITINGHYFREAGSTIVQELAFSLASANEYLYELTIRGISIDTVARHLLFSFGTGSNYFLEIAKLRAARYLWAKIVEKYHPEQQKSSEMFIHSTTTLWNKTIYDPYVNMLRTATEGMAAAIGNADSISVAPFDIAFAEPGEFSARIARNQQLILKEEAYLDKVIDPSAGSYFIENLTHSLVVHSWELFLSIEDKGGFIECIKSGFVQDEIEVSCRKKETDIALRKSILVGTNQHPNLAESMLDKISADSDKTDPETPSKFKKLNLSRVAHSIEKLRLDFEKSVASGRKKPAVYLLTYGDITKRKARANFATGFFGCAGYEVIEPITFKTIEESIKSALESKAEIVVICSSDEEYATIAPTVAQGLKNVNPGIKVIVAGFPKEIIDSLKQTGVDDFIHLGSNLVETLTRVRV